MKKSAPWPSMKRDLVAILRGLRPENALAVADVLVEAGFEAIEIPLNSPDPFKSIEMVAKKFGDTILFGAGTVLTAGDVDRLHDAGGRLLVSPNIDTEVMARACTHAMVTMPGVLTPTEALAALAAGASGLKFFPASVLGPAGIAAISPVLPKGTVIGAVGGVSDLDFAAYAKYGIRVFGLGSSLFRPDMDISDIARRAKKTVSAWDAVYTRSIEV
ncbi:2-dehydro-3-deoxy-6-phosphogalactonate aldolase [Mesorhizobium sp. 10J20-29]